MVFGFVFVFSSFPLVFLVVPVYLSVILRLLSGFTFGLRANLKGYVFRVIKILSSKTAKPLVFA
jgi:hypothetical protein